MDSWLKGMERDSEINLINYETASAQVMHPQYIDERDTLPLKYLLEQPESLIARLDAEGIAATPRIDFLAELFVRQDPYPDDGSLIVKAIALDPAQDDSVYKLKETVNSGALP